MAGLLIGLVVLLIVAGLFGALFQWIFDAQADPIDDRDPFLDQLDDVEHRVYRIKKRLEDEEQS
ncbi:MAG: hypothetical protein GEU78_15010 [Actinobacteria bacterium]|nr:hypothetical protein [Actinomycetota bacterium]